LLTLVSVKSLSQSLTKAISEVFRTPTGTGGGGRPTWTAIIAFDVGLKQLHFFKKAGGPFSWRVKAWTRMLNFYTDHREEFLTHYHKRSNVETTFHMIKSKFGQRLRSKTLTAQINEALCKVLCHNLCVVIQSQHELGIDVDFSEGQAA